MRRFPAPWRVEAIAGGFKVIDANGQSLAYVYSRENQFDAHMAKVLTEDEARRIASNIAKLPTLLGKGWLRSTLTAGRQFNAPYQLAATRHHCLGGLGRSGGVLLSFEPGR